LDFEEYKSNVERIRKDYERKHRRDKLFFQIAAVLALLFLFLLIVSCQPVPQ
jgi:hypothetical protein